MAVETTEEQAGAGVHGAGTGAGSQTVGTGAGTAEAGVGTQSRLAQVEAVSDIGLSEAYQLELKRLTARELDHDASILAIERRALNAASSALENLMMVNSSAMADLIKGGSTAVVSEIHKTMRTSLHEVDDLTNMGDELERVIVASLAKMGIDTAKS
jgi:hypothetical protein